ncbi:MULTISPECIES: class I mannose-6-phosphate isomerase [Niastella]|uniref:Class I mannose-6-phosphate isomerase n=1 Tax=Niastella soli TaxID=2821487 RepID=A0ABS3Z598_9BACT|nr:class I mannose-6-phosphate isomerase [Niastella soli]MBO9204912.1 class I mannose-6-phosphate isomerase [Niastella soli]
MYETSENMVDKEKDIGNKRRVSSQPLLPQQIQVPATASREYNMYPFHTLGADKIFDGYHSLAKWMTGHQQIIIDGYGGIFWKEVKQCLQTALQANGMNVHWIDVSTCMKKEEVIDEMVAPFLGIEDSVWGTKCNFKLSDFFNMNELLSLQSKPDADCTIVYGTGAALISWDAPVVYLDLPKNEIQYRMRAGSITNLGNKKVTRSSNMYKRLYFVDWVVLNEYKKNLLPNISVIADGQWKESLNWMLADSLREGLSAISKNVFRVRPWFEAGAWGGQWMKAHIKELDKEEVNYAWSFELIVPENGLVFESNGNLLEVSFDCLMYQENNNILGKHAGLFGYEFPIRFDFLDTWEGGNLSIQCHPTLQYIRENFGETITQDETYYILDCKEDAQVFLGFQENIDPAAFRQVLENSKASKQEIAINDYVLSHAARKHELFLIPNGTVHSAGVNNLVLEISATPYIFTFKMYDWLRLDLNGEPRAINIEHAFNNLNFERRGEKVKEELISKQMVVEQGNDWQLVHCPTHPAHFYDVHRIEFVTRYTIQTNNTCHILMLVEGSSISVETAGGDLIAFNYAETFVIPAAATQYTLINNSTGIAKVVIAFCKENITELK